MNPEFNIGDLVTFHPYEKAIPAKVVAIVPNPNCFGRFVDDRVFYHLSGTNPKLPLVSTCSGNSIVESIYYKTNKEGES